MTTDGLTMNRDDALKRTRILVSLYFGRGIFVVLWAAAFAQANQRSHAAAIGLLISYPLVDAVSSLIDYRANRNPTERGISAFNSGLSFLAAVALGLAGPTGPGAALGVFGAWAVIAGAEQFLLGFRRRGAELGLQWPMLIAGGLSFIVGIFYDIQAVSSHPSLKVLSVYATGGGVAFIIQAGLLAWRGRQRQRLLTMFGEKPCP